jgi:hypothetical protein
MKRFEPFTLEEVKEHYLDLLNEHDTTYLNIATYNKKCKPGFTAHYIKKFLKLGYTEFQEACGCQVFDRKLAKNQGIGGELGGKIYCLRSKSKICRSDCVPNSDPNICYTCPDRQINNVKAIDILSKEEEDNQKYNHPSHMDGHDLYNVDIAY